MEYLKNNKEQRQYGFGVCLKILERQTLEGSSLSMTLAYSDKTLVQKCIGVQNGDRCQFFVKLESRTKHAYSRIERIICIYSIRHNNVTRGKANAQLIDSYGLLSTLLQRDSEVS